MRCAHIFLCVAAVCFAGCVSMEPAEFANGHPANPQSETVTRPVEQSLLRSYEIPSPGLPQLDRREFVNEQSLDHTTTVSSEQLYTCPMHPEIVQNTPGDCPICKMRLVPKVAHDAGGSEP